jgi:hypothetical protein
MIDYSMYSIWACCDLTELKQSGMAELECKQGALVSVDDVDDTCRFFRLPKALGVRTDARPACRHFGTYTRIPISTKCDNRLLQLSSCLIIMNNLSYPTPLNTEAWLFYGRRHHHKATKVFTEVYYWTNTIIIISTEGA